MTPEELNLRCEIMEFMPITETPEGRARQFSYTEDKDRWRFKVGGPGGPEFGGPADDGNTEYDRLGLFLAWLKVAWPGGYCAPY